MVTKSEKISPEELSVILNETKYQNLSTVMSEHGVDDVFVPGKKKVELIQSAIEAYSALVESVGTQQEDDEEEYSASVDKPERKPEPIQDEVVEEVVKQGVDDNDTEVPKVKVPKVKVPTNEILKKNIATLRLNMAQASNVQKPLLLKKIAELESKLK